MQANFKVVFHRAFGHESFQIGSSDKNDFYVVSDYIIIYA